MTQLINKDSLKAKLNWLFSHDTVSVDDINMMYSAAIMVRDMFEKNTASWTAVNGRYSYKEIADNDILKNFEDQVEVMK